MNGNLTDGMMRCRLDTTHTQTNDSVNTQAFAIITALPNGADYLDEYYLHECADGH